MESLLETPLIGGTVWCIWLVEGEDVSATEEEAAPRLAVAASTAGPATEAGASSKDGTGAEDVAAWKADAASKDVAAAEDVAAADEIVAAEDVASGSERDWASIEQSLCVCSIFMKAGSSDKCETVASTRVSSAVMAAGVASAVCVRRVDGLSDGISLLSSLCVGSWKFALDIVWLATVTWAAAAGDNADGAAGAGAAAISTDSSVDDAEGTCGESEL